MEQKVLRQGALRSSFETQLKEKLSLKTSSFTTEEATLQKMFKYFDLNNNGRVDPKEWKKAIEKIGVVLSSDAEIKLFFDYYDTDKSGYLDYKEFGAQLFGRSASPMKSPSKKAPTPASPEDQLQGLVARIRKILASRGARSIFGLGRQFRIMDNNRSRSLDYYEFSQALRDYQLNCSTEEYQLLFGAFDRNHDGTVVYDEFLREIRGPLSPHRRQIVHRAFKKIDKDGSGVLNIQDIRGTYNAKNHPDVKSGKKTEQEVLLEFLDTFEEHHNANSKSPGDGNVTLEEFEEYYANVSASMENDQYFELMMSNAWKMDVGDYQGSRTYAKAWSNTQGAAAASPGDYAKMRSPTKGAYTGIGRHPQPAASGAFPGAQVDASAAGSRDVPSLLARFRKSLTGRGSSGIIGLARQFKIMDDNHSLSLDWNEFVKACKDYRVSLPDADLKTLFNAFDVSHDGSVSYDEFLRAVRGPLSPAREKIVREAFSKVDRTGDGTIDINDIKGTYNARNHPDVRSGKKSEDEVLSEFLMTFETHHYIRSGSGKDSRVTWEEFKEYYENVGASVDDDRYFELMMINAWKLRGTDKPVQAAWSNTRGSAQPPPVNQMAPFGTSTAATDYSTSLRPMSQASAGGRGGGSYNQAAGVPTWPTMGTNGANPTEKRTDQQLLQLFRDKLSKRGVRGMLGMQRTFKIIDDDQSHDLNMTEFKKAIRDYRIAVTEPDAERLFAIFDVDRSGAIDYSEFIRHVRGQMNDFRKGLVHKAFKIMDKTGDGALQIDDVRQNYNASLHPDVRSGKKTEDEVLTEFLDTFELQYNLSKGLPPKGDDKVTLPEFIEYYENVSANIDNDLYFELMMNRVWNLDNSRVTKKGWGGEV